MAKLSKLRERRYELLKAIEITKQRKKKLSEILENLKQQHNSGRISGREYTTQLNKTLKNRTPEQWERYYNDYLDYYLARLNSCRQCIKKESQLKINSPQILIILIVLVLLGIFISLIFILQPVIKPVITDLTKGIGEKVSGIFEARAPSKIVEAPEAYEEPEVEVSLENSEADIFEESLFQYQAVVSKPVKWKKQFSTSIPSGFNVILPADSKNIKVKNIESGKDEDITPVAKIDKKGKFWFGKERVEVSVDEKSKKYELEYETPAPQATEEPISNNKKRVIIKGPDEVHYKNILSFASLPLEVKKGEEKKIRLYQIKKQYGKEIRQEQSFTAYDTDENNLLDTIEWITSYLSEAEFEIIIEISRAEHLSSDRATIINDISREVEKLDGVWSEKIYHNEYLRVIFEKELDNTKNITFYAKNMPLPPDVAVNTIIEVYDGNSVVAEFPVIDREKDYTVQLNGMLEGERSNVFDLKIVNLKGDGWAYLEFERVFSFIPFVGVNACGELSQADSVYALTDNIEASLVDNCIKITAPNIVLDCQGYSILSEDDYAGIYSNQINTTIRNCGVDTGAGGKGIELAEASKSNLYNNTLSNQNYGLFLSSSDYVVIEDNKIKSNDYGLFLSSSDYVIVEDMQADSNEYGIYLEGSSNNNIEDSDFSGNTNGVLLIGSRDNIFLNTSYNLDKEEVESDSELIRKWHYQSYVEDIYGKSVKGAEVKAYDKRNNLILSLMTDKEGFTPIASLIDYVNRGERDYYSNYTIETYHLIFGKEVHNKNVTLEKNIFDEIILGEVAEVTRCGVLGRANTVYTQTRNIIQDKDEDCIIIAAENATFNGNSYSIISDFPVIGVYSNQPNTTIKNCDVSMKEIRGGIGIKLNSGADTSYIYNCTLNNQFIGLLLDGASNVEIENISVSDNAGYGVKLFASSNNILTNNTVNSNGYGIYLEESSNNNLTDTEVLNSNDYDIYLKSSMNNIFLNVSYDLDKEEVEPDSELIRKWHYQAYVEAVLVLLGVPVGEAKVEVYDKRSDLILSLMTNKDGLTPITSLIDYVTLGGERDYYSNYKIFATKNDLGGMHVWNVTQEKSIYDEFFLKKVKFQIIYVSEIGSVEPTPGGIEDVNFNFIASHPQGFGVLDSNTMRGVFSKLVGGEPIIRGYTGCSFEGAFGSYYAKYSCTVGMQYYDEPGEWGVAVAIADNAANWAINSTTSFIYGETGAIGYPASLEFGDIDSGDKDVFPSSDLMITNNGNLKVEGIGVTGTNLVGNDGITKFKTDNFWINNQKDCAGIRLSEEEQSIPNSDIEVFREGSEGWKKELFLCIKEVPVLPPQHYSTPEDKGWALNPITIFMVVFVVSRKRKLKNKTKKKTARNDKLVGSLNLITEELKEQYSEEKQEIIKLLINEIKKKYKINNKEVAKLIDVKKKPEIPVNIFSQKLEALEAISKYMKENLNMPYHRIAELLNRDERTIWTSYNRARKKQFEGMRIEKIEKSLPISIFKDKLTILESVIVYLKQELKYIEIAKLLNRDQRNIWTIYSRAKKKIKI